ncbi:TCAF factor, partial [Polypterus senegalus]|nr:TCAF factor [Polypterus senegalus]
MDLNTAYQTLVKGVDTFNFTGDAVPCELLLIGPTAFPVAVNDEGQVLVAASTYGKGRLVFMGHEVYISDTNFGQFLINAITWLCPTSDAVVGVQTNLTFLSSHLRDAGFKVQSADKFTSNMKVYCMDAYNDSQANELIQFVKNGGSLLIAGQAWHWSYSHKEDVLQNFPGNIVTGVSGVYFTSLYGEKGEYKVSKKLPLSSFLVLQNGNITKDSEFLLRGVTKFDLNTSSVPSSLLVHGQLAFPVLLDEHNQALIAASYYGKGRIVVLTHEAYLTHLKTFVYNALNWLGAQKGGKICIQEDQTYLYEILIQEGFSCELSSLKDDTNVYCCTSYSDHQAEQIHEFVSEGGGLLIGGQAWSWYYSHPDQVAVAGYPGNKILNKFGISITSTTLDSKVQIGCHTDDLSGFDELQHPPVVFRRIHINNETVSVSSLWGGLIYIIVPGGRQSCVADWQKTLSRNPAPWAELEADNIILTVPTSKISHITNPEPLLHLWNRITKSIAELAALPERFLRPERIVADVQISAGYMHAGYPVMLLIESVQDIADLQFMQTNPIWGPLHELGHNQQRPLWEFPPHTTEATCNLWSVYVHEKVLNLPRSKAHSQLTAESREERIKNYIKRGSRLDDWTVWTCLETYLQLQEGFGWEPFIALFSDYQQMSISEHLDNKAKMNLWAEKFSFQVNRNLVPFFKAWGWPIEEDVCRMLATLPEWKENPMKAFA